MLNNYVSKIIKEVLSHHAGCRHKQIVHHEGTTQFIIGGTFCAKESDVNLRYLMQLADLLIYYYQICNFK